MAPGKRTSAHKKAKAKTTQTVALEEYQELLEAFEVKKSETEELQNNLAAKEDELAEKADELTALKQRAKI